MRKFFTSLKDSVSFKILLATILTGILINIVLLQFFRLNFEKTQPFYIKNTIRYIEYILEDYEENPSRDFFRHIERRYGIAIRPANPTFNFRAIENTHKKEIIFRSPNTVIFGERGRISGFIRKGQKVYSVNYHGRPPLVKDDFILFLLFSLITVIFIISYIYIRVLLKPLKYLNQGIDKISSGNLNYEVPVIRNDDLGKLTKSFNIMNSKLRNMITSKEQLMVDVSHELRTPLTRVKLALAMMDENKFSESISEDIVELEEMINEILDTAKSESNFIQLEKTNFPISEAIYTALKKCGVENAHYRININEDFSINADKKQIIKVVKNIIDNALKYSDTQKEPLTIETKKEDGLNILEIKDGGPGIPENELLNIFEPFYRIDKSRNKTTKGFGLGLNMCKKIMQLHNYTIKAKNREEGGLCMKMTF